MARIVATACLLLAALAGTPAGAETPTHDDRADAREISLPSTEVVSTAQATDESGEPGPSCGQIRKTVWYRFSPAVDTELVVDVEDTDFEVRMAVYIQEASGDLREVVCSGSHMDTGVRGGETAYVQLGGALLFSNGGFYLRPQSGTLTLAFTTRDDGRFFFSPPPNDEIAHATMVGALPFSDIQNLHHATLSPDEPQDCLDVSPFPLNRPPATIWYRYTATSSRPLDVGASGFYNGMTIAVYREGDGAPEPVACERDDAQDHKALVFTPIAGETYLIQASKVTGDQIAQDLWFGMGEAPTVDFAVTGVRPLAQTHPRWRDVEVEVASVELDGRGSGDVTLWGCSTVIPERCSVLVEPTSPSISSRWCRSCTLVLSWDGTYPGCVGTITLKATVAGFGTVDPNAENDALTASSPVLADPGAGTCR